MLVEIKKQAQKIANSSQKEIVVAVYRNLITAHNDFCGCNYCVILKDYVQMKRYLSANNRRMDDPSYDFWDYEMVGEDLRDIKQIREKIKELKQQKNQLKIL